MSSLAAREATERAAEEIDFRTRFRAFSQVTNLEIWEVQYFCRTLLSES
jgi:hypothetical protein